MARNTSVALGDHFVKLIEDQVASGRYASASEVVRAGLRLLEEREARLEELRAELRKGEESGDPLPFEPEKWRAEWKATWEAEEASEPTTVGGSGDASRPASRRA
jgi:antitoxin ParD1/3/4